MEAIGMAHAEGGGDLDWRDLVESDPVRLYCPLPGCEWRVGHPSWGFVNYRRYVDHVDEEHYVGAPAAPEPLVKGRRS